MSTCSLRDNLKFILFLLCYLIFQKLNGLSVSEGITCDNNSGQFFQSRTHMYYITSLVVLMLFLTLTTPA